MRRRLEIFSTQRPLIDFLKSSWKQEKLGRKLTGCLIEYGIVCLLSGTNPSFDQRVLVIKRIEHLRRVDVCTQVAQSPSMSMPFAWYVH